MEEIQRNVNMNLRQNLVAAYSEAKDYKSNEKDFNKVKNLMEGQ